MHRSLVVTADPAWPPVSGADLRNWQVATALAALGPVALASLLPTIATKSPEGMNLKVFGLLEQGERRRDAFDRKRTSVDRKIPRVAVDRLRGLADEMRPDAVVVEGISLHPLLATLRGFTGNLILDMHNIESDMARQVRALRFSRAPLLSSLVDRDPERIRRAEEAAARLVDRIWVCSREDRRRLLSIAGNVPCHVVPNGVPRSGNIADPAARRDSDRPEIVFVGHLGYAPNVRAVTRLVERIMPLVRGRLPGSRLVVAGRSPARRVRRLAAGGTFELIADPPSVDELLAGAHVSIVPLEVGGGTRIKVLEAMAAGVPVVATPLAAEGLDLDDGIHVLLADRDGELAAAVETLCTDPERWQRQSVVARRRAMENYGPEAVSRAVRDGLGVAPGAAV